MTGFCAGRMVRDGPVPVLRGIPPTMPPRCWGRQAGRSRSAGVRGTPVIGGRPASGPCTGGPDGTEDRDPGVPPVTGGRPTVGPCPLPPPPGAPVGGENGGWPPDGGTRPGGTATEGLRIAVVPPESAWGGGRTEGAPVPSAPELMGGSGLTLPAAELPKDGADGAATESRDVLRYESSGCPCRGSW